MEVSRGVRADLERGGATAANRWQLPLTLAKASTQLIIARRTLGKPRSRLTALSVGIPTGMCGTGRTE